jgi:hypothetical protein
MSKQSEIIIEVIATVVLIIGVALTSFNIYPMNIYVSLLGNLLWLIMGLMWRKWSLIVIQIFISILYTGGLIKMFVT